MTVGEMEGARVGRREDDREGGSEGERARGMGKKRIERGRKRKGVKIKG